MTPGIHLNIANEDYHAGPGISKSGLWTIATRTPAHFRYGERKDSAAFDLGTAAHLALLEPHEFEGQVVAGPEDRRGNKWKDAELQAAAQGAILLTAGDYDKAMRIRDAGECNATLRDLRRGAVCEASGYAIDPETGMLCRCRPDAFNAAAGVILDLKTTTDGGRDAFGRAAANFGYHVQEAFYSDVWHAAGRIAHVGGKPLHARVDAFIFVVIEKTAPFLVSCYELAPSAVDEGRETYKRALDTYARCVAADEWPGYPEDPEPLDIPPWAYRNTVRPQVEA
jgi:exodeoxyribonuclease VIII